MTGCDWWVLNHGHGLPAIQPVGRDRLATDTATRPWPPPRPSGHAQPATATATREKELSSALSALTGCSRVRPATLRTQDNVRPSKKPFHCQPGAVQASFRRTREGQDEDNSRTRGRQGEDNSRTRGGQGQQQGKDRLGQRGQRTTAGQVAEPSQSSARGGQGLDTGPEEEPSHRRQEEDKAWTHKSPLTEPSHRVQGAAKRRTKDKVCSQSHRTGGGQGLDTAPSHRAQPQSSGARPVSVASSFFF